jgi:hypothetical protein
MADHNTLIEISAFSALAGALVTQLMNGLFVYYSDKRKYRIEVKNAYRNKKIEIGENFYYLNGETMSLLKKSIAYWRKRNQFTSERSLEFIGKEIKQTEEHIAKVYADNWKYNLVNLYFKVNLSIDEINEENQKSHGLFIKVRELADRIKDASEEDKEALYGEYSFSTYDLVNQYEHIYSLLEQDMNVVKDELLREFDHP